MNQNRDGQWEAPARNEQRTNNQGENPPGMLAMEAKVNQFAEGQSYRDSLIQPYISSGDDADYKVAGQTFSSFLNKAKAKYSEFQENQQQRQAENAGINARESNWGMEPAQSQNRSL